MAKRKDEVKEAVQETNCFCMSAEQVALMRQIINATQSEAGMLHVLPDDVNPLVVAGYVEVNPNIALATGEIASRATEKGIHFMNVNHPESVSPLHVVQPGTVVETLQEKELEVKAEASNGFVIVKGAALSKAKRGGRSSGNKWPFDKMEVGDTFFIAATEDVPEPAKQYASTVSGATNRYSVEVPGETRERKVLLKDDGGKPLLDGEGRKTYRVETVLATKQTRKFVIRKEADGAQWGFPGVAGAGVGRIA